MTDREALVICRDALAELKNRYQEECGGWILVDFMAAAADKEHWMNKIRRAEKALKEILGEEAEVAR